MPRSIWTGSISFGLVSVPVRLFTATESKEVRFHFLDRRDLTPIGYDKVSKETGKHVDADEVVRGFEVAKGRFVELSEEDIDRLDMVLTHSIDICDFVSIDEIDPM
jgi:DNA end-binding protein Ku